MTAHFSFKHIQFSNEHYTVTPTRKNTILDLSCKGLYTDTNQGFYVTT